ncbi:MAG: amino acid adenylation domain-containing protein, partial [Williamsia sp.]|nr:amino acid adenylation domain-containing protein [Williamsia sp.]
RGMWMVVGVLAILKAGGCYVPLDPDYPAERLSFMIGDAQVKTVVSTKESRVKLESLKDIEVLQIDNEWEIINNYPAANPPAVSAEQLAYLIYTSGSTGLPKGVMVEHKSVVNLLKSIDHLIGFGPGSKFLSVTTFCFDICYLEFFVPLINGGKLVMVSRETTADGIKLAEAIHHYQPTHMQGTPSTWQLLLDSGWDNKEGVTMLIGGEAVTESVKNALTKMGNVYNLYGPTETTIWSTAKQLYTDERVLIGKPLANTSIYIVDEQMELVPVGVAGEIWIGGAGVARGYLGNRDQTAVKFVSDRFKSDPTSRVYRTGDRGRWLDNGNIEYLGRMDEQVKIRGFRIELGEIEGVLQDCSLVHQAAVIAPEDKHGNKQLIGYVVAKGDYDRQGIIAYLKTRLPDYMVPSLMVQMESLPLNSSGKIDKKALPPVDPDSAAREVYAAPVNEAQKILADIWQLVLQTDRIGIYDNFFELGGQSLLAARVVSAARRQLQVEMGIKDLFFYPTIATLEASLRQQHNGLLPGIVVTHPRPVCVPLSYSQERFWFIHQLEGSIQYHLPAVLRFKGNLHKDALNGAFQYIMNRHEILRTVISGEQDKACQSVQDASNWRLRFHEDTLYKSDSQALQQFVHVLIQQPFDLSADYMLRADVIRLAPQDHLLVTTIHHIASDGWSTSIIVKELLEVYTALVEERPVQFQPLKVQYADYALWQREALQGQLYESQLDYWKKKLEGTPVLQLLTDYSRPPVWSARGASIRFNVEKQLTDALKKLSHQQGVTLFMTLLAAFKVMLQRYSGQHDICIGTPVANRNQPELEGLIGCFINTLALRSDLSQLPSFTTLLQQLKNTTLEAYAHQEVPFEKVVEAVGNERDMSRNPLVQVLFSMQNTPEVPALRLQAAQVTEEGYQPVTAQLDIIYNVAENVHGLEVSVVYCSDLFSEQTMWRMASHFKQLLQAVSVSPDRCISSLKMLGPQEQQWVEAFSSRSAGKRERRTVVALFEEQVARKTDQTALVYQEQELSFQQLNERANQLAHYLIASGIKREARVVVCLDRSPALIVTLLGILKAGGAYVPVDAGYPAERIAMLLEDSRAALIISSTELQEKLPAGFALQTVLIDADWPFISSQDAANPQIDIAPDQLAYLIYTSGSSGKPKGVMVEHHNLSNYLVNSKTDYLNSTTETSGSFVHLSSSFDASVTALFMPLVFGKRMVIASNRSVHVFEDANLHRYAPYDFIKITPSHLPLLEPKLRTASGSLLTGRLVIGGEALLGGQLGFLQQEGIDIEIINEYGPTETTVGCSVFSLRPRTLQEEGQAYKSVPIGKPIDHARIYILGAGNELLPVGAIGEICIAGAGVARRYLHGEEGSNKFVKDPFCKDENARMYKSGDMGRWLQDGNIEYIGRRDEQVKIKGYRIELGEIENALQAHTEVKEVAVLAYESKDAPKRLVAFIVAGSGYHEEAVKAYAKEHLPDYMIPDQWVEITSMPLTFNGKVDRKRLPDIKAKELISKELVLPRNKTEAVLAELWQNLLGVETAGVHDNFFELGGDSISSIQLVNQARKTGHMFQIDDVFNYQTIAKLASLIDEQAIPLLVTPFEKYSLQEHVGLLPIQQWYFEKEPVHPSYFNQAILLDIDKRVEEALLRKAFELIVAHHDVLQFRYYKKEGQWYQVYDPHSVTRQIMSEDLRSVLLPALGTVLTERSNHYQQSLDIEQGDLIRAVLMQTPPTETANRLLVVVHHLVMDGVSWRILLRELEWLIGELITDSQPDLGTKSSSYRQWYNALERYGQQSRTLSQIPYWKEIVQNYNALPCDKYNGKPVKQGDMRHQTVRLDKQHTQALIYDVPAAYHTEINDLLLAALVKTLTRFAQMDTIIIGMEGHGREFIEEGTDVGNTLGWFTSLFPLLIRVDKKEGADLIKQVKEQVRNVPDKGLGFGVLKYINREEAFREGPFWNLIFNYFGQADNVLHHESWFGKAKEAAGSEISPDLAMNEKMIVNAIVQEGELVVDWAYSSKHYHEETVNVLVEQFLADLALLISHCTAQLLADGPAYTPSDYGLAKDITYQELDSFLAEPYQGKPRKESLESLYLLSGLQEGILFHGLYDKEGAGYLNHFACDLLLPDLDILRKSWNHLLQSHTILRSAFDYNSFSKPVQAVYKAALLPIEIIDCSSMDETEQTATFAKLEEADRAKGFDFKTVPLMRIYLVRMQENRYRMLWSAHHILFDGWSRSNIISEFLHVYELYASGKPLPVIKEDRFEDYIRYLGRAEKQDALAYWKEYLKFIEQRTLLPFISATPERNKGVGQYASSVLNIDEAITAKTTRFIQHHRITMNTLMQGVWSYLLHRYTNSERVVFGVIVSGRPDELPDVGQRVGMFINTLPLCACYRKDQSVVEWLQSIQHDQVASRHYQYTPLGEIQNLTGIQGDLFDSLLVVENYPVSKAIANGSKHLAVENILINEQTNYPFTIFVEQAEQVTIRFSYNIGMVKEEWIHEVSRHFKQVLLQMIEGDQRRLNEIELLTAAEKEQLLHHFNHSKTAASTSRSMLDLFEHQADKNPESIALVMNDQQISYRELNEQANQVAHYLQTRGVKKGSLVPVWLERSIELVVGILGILKAGGAYVPADPEYPVGRLLYTIEDAGASIIFTDQDNASKLPAGADFDLVLLDADWPLICSQSSANLTLDIAPDQLAYVIYTSGSTGNPKGVMITHSNLDAFIDWCMQEFASTRFDLMYASTSICFDLSIFEIFYPLSIGKPVRILENGLQIGKQLAADSNVMVNTVPSVIEALLADGTDLSPLSALNMAGEVITDQVLQNLDTAAIEVRNLYGPTESTTYSTICRLKKEGQVTIGKPISNTRIYIINSANQLAPVGVQGEICIAGAGLSGGYLNRPELTAEKFVTDPFASGTGEKMYRTGDWGRWLADGNIEYLGRMDDQVKIRGYRIEPGEIESVLLQSGLVSKAAVMVKLQDENKYQLVGYVVPAASYQKPSLIRYLKERLPEYMLPGLWVEMNAFPLTPNGKIDRKALPDSTELKSRQFILPRNEVEVKLTRIWKEILRTEQIGICDDFFEWGGNSILAMRLTSSIRRELNIELPVKLFFELRTIEELASFIKVNQSSIQLNAEDYEALKL